MSPKPHMWVISPRDSWVLTHFVIYNWKDKFLHNSELFVLRDNGPR